MVSSLRPRTRKIKPESYATVIDQNECYNLPSHTTTINNPATAPSTPPVYTIDLSLPPEQRYAKVALDFEDRLGSLKELFDDVLGVLKVPTWFLHLLARLFLWRLYSAEQTRELKGISRAVNVPLYLLIAYNVFLDLFMGCTSGGVLVQPPESSNPRMMHFRTLDWGMPQLRDVLVQYDFVERPGGKVIARTIGYVGFVGVLTGVKKNLSVSLNFRPYHNDGTSIWANMKFYAHLVFVLFGFRPSIAAILRDFMIPHQKAGMIDHRGTAFIEEKISAPVFGRPDICITLPGIRSTAAYLTFCTGDETIILEKDLRTAKILRSSTFINTTNHDASYDDEGKSRNMEAVHTMASKPQCFNFGMEVIVEESIERKKCLARRWERWCGALRSKSKKRGSSQVVEKGVELDQLKEWMVEYPVTNEDTHFACIMDPEEGTFRWIQAFDEGEIEGSDG